MFCYNKQFSRTNGISTMMKDLNIRHFKRFHYNSDDRKISCRKSQTEEDILIIGPRLILAVSSGFNIITVPLSSSFVAVVQEGVSLVYWVEMTSP